MAVVTGITPVLTQSRHVYWEPKPYQANLMDAIAKWRALVLSLNCGGNAALASVLALM